MISFVFLVQIRTRKFASEIYRPLLPHQQLVQMPDGKLRIFSKPTAVQQQPQPVQQPQMQQQPQVQQQPHVLQQQPGPHEQSPIPRLV